MDEDLPQDSQTIGSSGNLGGGHTITLVFLCGYADSMLTSSATSAVSDMKQLGGNITDKSAWSDIEPLW